MPLEIVEFQDKHVQDAASLFTARYRALRDKVLSLPSRYGNASAVEPLLHDLVRQGPGVAAIRNGRLVGFLQGMLLTSFRGKRAILSPEWANAADPEDSRCIYQEMYARLSTRWVANGCFTHLVCMLAHDRDGMDGWHWLGFGMIAVDGVRDLALIPEAIADVEIRRAGSDDLE